MKTACRAKEGEAVVIDPEIKGDVEEARERLVAWWGGCLKAEGRRMKDEVKGAGGGGRLEACGCSVERLARSGVRPPGKGGQAPRSRGGPDPGGRVPHSEGFYRAACGLRGEGRGGVPVEW